MAGTQCSQPPQHPTPNAEGGGEGVFVSLTSSTVAAAAAVEVVAAAVAPSPEGTVNATAASLDTPATAAAVDETASVSTPQPVLPPGDGSADVQTAPSPDTALPQLSTTLDASSEGEVVGLAVPATAPGEAGGIMGEASEAGEPTSWGAVERWAAGGGGIGATTTAEKMGTGGEIGVEAGVVGLALAGSPMAADGGGGGGRAGEGEEMTLSLVSPTSSSVSLFFFFFSSFSSFSFSSFVVFFCGR